MVSVGIPHHDSHVEHDVAGPLFCCIFLTILQTSDSKRYICTKRFESRPANLAHVNQL